MVFVAAGVVLAAGVAGPFALTGWQGAALVAAVLSVVYWVARREERSVRLRLLERNWALAGEKVELQEAMTRVEESYLGTLMAIAGAADANDAYASGHAARVASYAVKTGRALGLDGGELRSLERAAFLHDIGKIWIPGGVLTKEGPLTAEEVALVRQHPVTGAELLDAVRGGRNDAIAVLHHHERFDGTGYPYGLKGYNIPIEARILAVADAFDAMTSERPYRSAMMMGEALDGLCANAGSQFDPRVVEAFMGALEEISQDADSMRMVEKRFGARLYSLVGNC